MFYPNKKSVTYEGPAKSPSPKAIPYQLPATNLRKTQKHETNPILVYQVSNRPAQPPYFCGTNPISIHQYTIHNVQYAIPWPNFIPPRASYLLPQSGVFWFLR